MKVEEVFKDELEAGKLPYLANFMLYYPPKHTRPLDVDTHHHSDLMPTYPYKPLSVLKPPKP